VIGCGTTHQITTLSTVTGCGARQQIPTSVFGVHPRDKLFSLIGFLPLTAMTYGIRTHLILALDLYPESCILIYVLMSCKPWVANSTEMDEYYDHYEERCANMDDATASRPPP
jgi:hypothetical protein